MSHGATTDGSRATVPAPAAAKEQRVTKQRLAVSAVLDELTDFVSTQELHRILQDRGTSVSLATSYRILQSLADEGLVRLGEVPRIEHQHLAVLLEPDTGMRELRQLHPASLGVRPGGVHAPGW